jgi:hypothetical protein
MLSLIDLLIPQVYQSRKVGVSLENNISTLTTIPTIGSPKGNIFLPAETATAVSTIARLYGYGYLINKHGRRPGLKGLINFKYPRNF